MKVTVDSEPFLKERIWAAELPAAIRVKVWREVREASFRLERSIKIRMPVDTGRARASWGHSTPPASASDGVWGEDEPGMQIVQGSKVGYIEELNDGHSQQAPAGFIDAEEEKAAQELDKALSALFDGLI